MFERVTHGVASLSSGAIGPFPTDSHDRSPRFTQGSTDFLLARPSRQIKELPSGDLARTAESSSDPHVTADLGYEPTFAVA